MAKVKQEYILEVTAKGLKEVVNEIKALRADMSGLRKSTDNTSAGFNKVSKSSGEYDRNMKGAANATNNSTKAFSKMSQGMQGSLVPAYATVAANVFALTAAFGALERAADFQILVNSAEELAAQTGRSLVQLSKNMKAITGSAISMKEALTSASIAASAGFDNSTIEELTQVARNASVALGRDMTDSLNRVFKGAIKAEPELLDELGIILRLDPATREYAASIGKAVSELTTFEKQQAVVNAVLEQGQEKFGSLSDVDPNPYTQLAAAFSDLVNNILTFINVPLGAAAKVFSANILVFASAFGLFALSVTKAAFPALLQFGQGAKEAIARNNNLAISNAIAAESFKDFSDAAKAAAKAQRTQSEGVNFSLISGEIANKKDILGKDLTENITKAAGDAITNQDRLTAIIKTTGIAIKDLENKTSALTKVERERLLVLRDINAATKVEQERIKALSSSFSKLKNSSPFLAIRQQINAVIARTSVLKDSVVSGFGAGISEGFGAAQEEFKKYETNVLKAVGTTKIFGKTTRAAAKGLFLTAGALGSFIKFLPIIGQITFVFGIFFGIAKKLTGLFRDNDALERYNKAIDSGAEATKTAAAAINTYNKTLRKLDDTIDNVTKKTLLQRNVFSGLADTLNTIAKELPESFNLWDNLLDLFNAGRLDSFKEILEEQVEVLEKAGKQDQINELLEEFGTIARLSGEEALAFNKALIELNKTNVTTADIMYEANEAIKSTFESLGDGLDEVSASLPKLNAFEKQFVSLTAILNQFAVDDNLTRQISAISNLSITQASQLGLGDISTKFAEINNELKEENKLLEKNEKLLEEKSKAFATTYNIGGTSALLDELDTNIINNQEKINNLNAERNSLLDEAKKKLEDYRDVLAKMVDAENTIAKARSRLNFELSRSATFESQRLDIIKQITEAEKQYNASKSAGLVTRRNALVEEQQAIADAQAEAEKEQAKKGTIRKSFDVVLGLDDTAAAEAQTAQLRNITLTTERIALDKELKKSQEDTAKAYITQLLALEKEILRQNINVKLGIEGAEELRESLKLDFQISTKNAAPILKEASQSANEYVNSMIKVQENAQIIEDIKFDTFVTSVNNVETALLSMRLEAENLESANAFLKENIYLSSLRADAAEQANIKNQEATLSSLLAARNENAANISVVNQLNILIATTSALIEANQNLARSKRNAAATNAIESIALENKVLKDNIKLIQARGSAAKRQVQIDQLLEKNKGADPKTLRELEKQVKETFDLKIIQDFEKEIKGIRDSFTPLTGIFDELNDRLETLESTSDKIAAAFDAAAKAGNVFGDDTFEGISKGVIAIQDFAKDIETFTKGGFVDLAASASGALQGIGSAISQAAGENAKAAKAGAIIDGVGAVIKAWNSAPFPYNLPAIAATVLGVNKQLQAIDAGSVGGAGGGIPGQADVDAFKDSFGAQGVQGLDLQNNSLVESIDSLIDLETDLFGVQRDLVIATKELKESFSSIGSSLFKSGGTFSGVNILDLFGVSFGSIGKSSKLGTSSRTITNDLISAGLELSVAVSFVAGDIIASLEQARFALFQQVTVSKKSLFRSSTTTYIESIFEDLPREIREGLEKSLNSTVDFILGQFQSFGTKVQVDLTNLLSGLDNIIIDPTVLDLSDKTAQEQSEVVAAFFTGLTNDIIDQVLPFIGNFSQAGEELTDTLLRLTQQTIQLDNIFKTIGFDFTAAIPDFSGVTQTSLDLMNEAKFPDYSAALGDFTNATIEGIRDDIATQEKALANLSSSGSRGLWQIKWIKNIINRLNEQLEEELIIAGKGSIGFTNVDAYVEALKIQTLAEWETALLTNFKDVDELNVVFKQFSSTLFSQAKLADIALLNAKNVVTLGFEQLVGQLNDAGLEDFVGLLGAEPTAESLRAFYEAGNAAGIFSSKFDVVTGTFDNSGADIFATLIQLGAGLDNVTNAGEGAIEAINDFNKGIQRQIDTFGLVGKELDLLQLDFEFQDALKEAEEVGGNIALVEQLFGLKRIDIIRQYNQEIVDSITATSKSINDAMLSVVNTSEAWDEVIFQSLKVEKSAKRLKTSLGSLASGLDFSIFDVDLDTTTFETLFDSILQFESEIPTNINEQIELINDLKDSILDRYNAEAAAIDNLRNLATNIGDYLDSLKLNDISPLTNVERLAEAQDQFTTNLANLNSDDAAIRAKAQQDLTSSADTYLQSAQEYFGISAGFQDIFSNVTSALQSVQADLQTDIGLSTDTLAINALQEKTLEQLSTLDSILLTLEAQNDMDFQIEINAWADAIGAGSTLNDIVIKLQSLESAVWGTALTNIGSYDTGTPEIEFDQIAKVHKGEMILTPSTSEEVREGGAFITNEENISNTQTSITGSNEDIIAAIRVLTQVLADSQEDLLEQGEKLLIKETSTTSLLPATKTTRIL